MIPPSKVEVIVRWTAPGFHHWADAPDNRAYLRVAHYHLFHYEARLDTTKLPLGDRQIELHDVQAWLQDQTEQVWGGWSCEQIANHLCDLIGLEYKVPCSVSVFEDEECGAEVTIPKKDEVQA